MHHTHAERDQIKLKSQNKFECKNSWDLSEFKYFRIYCEKNQNAEETIESEYQRKERYL